MAIIDTHNHLYFGHFQKDSNTFVDQAKKAGITRQILIGVDEISNLAAINLNRTFPNTFNTVIGLHPCDVDKVGIKDPEWHNYKNLENYELQYRNLDQFFQGLESLYLENKDIVVGFGETGFDQFHIQSEKLLETQIESFYRHLELCKKYKKTLVIHSRSTTEVGIKLLNENKKHLANFPVVWHCFSDDAQTAQILTSMGVFLGIGGVATYPKSTTLREAILQTPIEFLITETDSPFLTPHKARKSGAKVNQPSFLPEIIQAIAEIKGLEYTQCEDKLYKNGLRSFDLTEG